MGINFRGHLTRTADAEDAMGGAIPQPNPCPYCGGELSPEQDTGRGTRVKCEQCGGTAVIGENGEFGVDLIGSPHNDPDPAPDPRSGGVGGVANDSAVQHLLHRSSLQSTVSRVFHNDAGCRVCNKPEGLHYSALAEPHANPYTGGNEWFHGTSYHPENTRDPQGYDPKKPGGTITAPTRSDSTLEHDRGAYMDESWNTDLGTHFSSIHSVAHHGFAKGGAMPDSRVAEAHLHMANPKHYEDESEMNSHAIKWARENNITYLHSKKQAEHSKFINGAFHEMDKPHLYQHVAEVPDAIGIDDRKFISKLDKHGPLNIDMNDMLSDRTKLAAKENYLESHPRRQEISRGFQAHLKEQGHDGIVYGNQHEGPSRHTCAIAFHDTPVTINRWGWHNDPRKSAPDHSRRNIEVSGPKEDPSGRERHYTATRHLAFEHTATWADVRNKAKRIVAEGGVQLLGTSHEGLVGNVQGDHGVYQTELLYVPGSRKVGYWHCGCRWGTWAWGRSSAFKRFEGRLCSHGLAMQFEALKQHAFDRGHVTPHTVAPEWLRGREVTVHHQRATDTTPEIDHRRSAALTTSALDPEGIYEPDHALDLARPPLYGLAVAARATGVSMYRTAALLRSAGFSQPVVAALVSDADDELRTTALTAGIVDDFRHDLMLMSPGGGGGGDIGGMVPGPRPEQREEPEPDEHERGEHEPGEPGDPGEPQGHDGGDMPGHDPLDEHREPGEHDERREREPVDLDGVGSRASFYRARADRGHKTHRTQDARAHADQWGVGVPADGRSSRMTACPQCTDGEGVSHGCGACGGTGQQVDGFTPIPDQNADAGFYSRNDGEGGGGIPTEGARHFAEYSANEWSPMEPVHHQHHSDTQNPGSTGWASGPDSGDWSGIGQNNLYSQSLDPTFSSRRVFAQAPEGHDTWFHVTDRHNFHPDPTFQPERASLAGDLGGSPPGLFLTKNPGHWAATHNYYRPWVAEVHAPTGIEHAPGNEHGGFGHETFVHPQHFDKLHVNRVMPYDAHEREQSAAWGVGGHGAMEEHHGSEFDTGAPISNRRDDQMKVEKDPARRNYRYSGPDAREMGEHQVAQHHQRWHDFMIQDKGYDPEDFAHLPHFKGVRRTAMDEAQRQQLHLTVQRELDKATDADQERHADDAVLAENYEPLKKSDLPPEHHAGFAFSRRSEANPEHAGLLPMFHELSGTKPKEDRHRAPVPTTAYRSPMAMEPLHLDDDGNAWARHDTADQRESDGAYQPHHQQWTGPHSASEVLAKHPTFSQSGGHDGKPRQLHWRTHNERLERTGTDPSTPYADVRADKMKRLRDSGIGVVGGRRDPGPGQESLFHVEQPEPAPKKTSFSYDEIGERHPHIYGAGSGDADGIGDAASHLAFGRPEDPDAEGHHHSELDFTHTKVWPKHVDYARTEDGHHDPRVRSAMDGYRHNPETMPPVVLVHRHGVYQVADGHHRAEAAHLLKMKLPAYVAHSPYPDEPHSTEDGETFAPYHGAAPTPGREHTAAKDPSKPRKDKTQKPPPLKRALGPGHDSKNCPICRAKNTGIVRRHGAPIAPPFANPHTKGQTWFHGTSFDPDSEDNDDYREEHHNPDPGGELRTPERPNYSHFDNASHHWNTDVGIHFSSVPSVAEGFANMKGDPKQSRVAHTALHMRNPIHFDDEHDMGAHAIDWARKNGHRFLPTHDEAHGHFVTGNDDEIEDHTHHVDYSEISDHVGMDHGLRHSISEMDHEGVSGHPLDHIDRYLAAHPHREEITEGWKNHLQSKGHDGIIYGNEYEGPRLHKCAIAFPETPIHVRKWDWHHRDAQHLNDNPPVQNHPQQTSIYYGDQFTKSAANSASATPGSFPIPFATAQQATARAAVDDETAWSIFMPSVTGGLSGVVGDGAVSFEDVSSPSAQPQVIEPSAQSMPTGRTAAAGIEFSGVAGVINDEPARWFADAQNPHQAMQVPVLPVEVHASVSVGASRSGPGVASIRDTAKKSKDKAVGQGPTHAGVCLKAADTGRILMLQRSFDDPSDPARGTWEMPGGGIEPDDRTSLHGAVREFEEEVGQPFPSGGHVHHTWTSGPYQGHLVVIPSEDAVDLSAKRTVANPDDDSEQRTWIHPEHARKYPDLRPEVKANTPWKKIIDAGIEKAAAYKMPDTGAFSDDHDYVQDHPDFYRYHGSKYRLHHSPLTGDQVNAYAKHGDGYRRVGALSWFGGKRDPDSRSNTSGGTVYKTAVSEKHRRKGLATAMWGFAKEVRPDLRHSNALSDDAKAWVDSGKVPDDMPDAFPRHEAARPSQHEMMAAGYDDESEYVEDRDHGDLGIKDAVLNDHPEPALPITEGGGDDDDELTTSAPDRFRAQMSSSIPENDATMGMGGGVSASRSVTEIVAAFQATGAAKALQGSGGGGDLDNAEIAAGAREALSKMSMKNFSPAERMQLISEGEAGPRARNFGDLQVSDTFYADLPDDEELGL